MATRSGSLGGSASKRQLVLVGVLFAVLLGVLGFLFLGGGGDETEEAAPPVAPPTVVESPTPPTATGGDEPADKPKDRPLRSFDVFATRDPFEPLVDTTGAAGTGAADAGTGTTETATDTEGTGDTGDTGDDGTDGDGTDDDGTDGADATAGDGTGTTGAAQGDADDDGAETVGGREVKLIDVFRKGGSRRARIQVDGTVYTVGRGDTFGDGFTLRSFSGDCASIARRGDTFTLCEGETANK
jgi:hypothetical protein